MEDKKTIEESKHHFSEWCKSKGIDGVNQYTSFRWDEVIDYSEYYCKSQQKQMKEDKLKL